MATQKSATKATKAKKTTKKAAAIAHPANGADFKKLGYTQVKSGRWIKDVAGYNEKVKKGLIDPETGLRTDKGRKAPAKTKATKKTTKKATRKSKVAAPAAA